MLPGPVFIVALQRVSQAIPDGIICCHLWQLFEFIHDFIGLVLERLFEIAILFFAADCAQFQRKLQQLFLDRCGWISDRFHSINQIAHNLPRRFGYFFICHVLLNIDFFQFVCVDRIRQNRLHMQQPVFPQETVF